MAETQEVQIKITADTSGADKSVGSIKKQLREATAELFSMRAQFGETSDEAVNAAKKVANLKDEIGDAKTLVDGFNPDAKFKGFGQVLQGVAGGFAAIQGAQALLGVESEEVQKTLLKVQGALALSQGIDSVLESGEAFKTLGKKLLGFTVIQKIATAAQALFNAVMSANPIGAIITAIALLIAGIAALTSYFISNAKAAKANALEIKANAKAIENAKKAYDSQSESLDAAQAQQIALAKANGASTQAIRDLEIKLIDEKIATDKAARATAFATIEKEKNYLATLKQSKASDELIKKQQENVNASIKNANEITANVNKDLINRRDIQNKQIVEVAAEEKTAAENSSKLREQSNKDASDKAKEKAEKAVEDEKALTKELKALQEESFLSNIKDDDERLKQKIEFDRIKKVKEIEAGAGSEKLKAQLIAEINAKAEADKLLITEAAEKKSQDLILSQDKKTSELLSDQRLAALTDEFDKKQFELTRNQENEIDADLDLFNKKLITKEQFELSKSIIDAKYKVQRDALSLDENTKELNKEVGLLAARANNNQLSLDLRRAAIDAEQLLIDEAFKNKVISEDEFNKKTKENSDARIALDQAETKAREDNLAKISSLLGSLSDLVGKQTSVGKAFAIAQATIDTYLSATKAYQSLVGIPIVGPGLAVVGAGAAIAAGIKNVKSILAVKVPGGGSGGGSVPTANSVPNAITAPIAPALGSTLINQGQVNQIGSAAARAYVVESDVSGNQERIQRINRAARIS